jgi:hypothetical protein
MLLLLHRAVCVCVQVVLRQHLQQHAYGTATAQQLLERILQLTPAEVSTNAVAVTIGWHNPGSPVLQVIPAANQVGCWCVEQLATGAGAVLTTRLCAACHWQGFAVRQQRFCSWGLLQDAHLQTVLANAPSAGDKQIAAPPVSNSSLLCPASVAGRDRAVPWTPVRLMLLPSAALRAGNSSSSSSSSNSSGACAAWHVVMHDEQQLPRPEGSACVAAPGQLYVLEGDGGSGLYHSLYTSSHRAAVRAWVASDLPALLAAAPQQQQLPPLQLLLTASKLLQDQAALGLSAFGEVPGDEVWAALQAAVNATAKVHQLPGASPGFGTALNVLVAPLLPSVEALLDRLAVDGACWQDKRVRAMALASLLSVMCRCSGLHHHPSP